MYASIKEIGLPLHYFVGADAKPRATHVFDFAPRLDFHESEPGKLEIAFRLGALIAHRFQYAFLAQTLSLDSRFVLHLGKNGGCNLARPVICQKTVVCLRVI